MYVGNTELYEFKQGKQMVTTGVPGLFPFGETIGFEPGENMESEWSWSKCGFEDDIHISAHAVVWMEVECPPVG